MNVESKCPTHFAYAALFAVFVGSGLAYGDVLELEDGRVIVGTYVDGTTDFILFEVDGDIVAYPVGDIRSMGLSEAEPPPRRGKRPRDRACGHSATHPYERIG